MDINPKALKEALVEVLSVGLVPFITGSPGTAKSDIVKQVASDFNLQLIDVRLSQMDPTDLSGIPFAVNGRLEYLPPKVFPIEGDKIPEGKAGWCLLLDEFNSAPLSVQASAYKLVLDKQVGQYNLHPKVAIVLAGNKQSDRAITNRISTAMQSRLIHFNLEVSSEDWLSWAEDNDIDHRIKSFIRFRPELLHKFNPTHSDNTFPTPRTWFFCNKLIKDKPITSNILPILAGTIGEGCSIEFKGFLDVYQEIPEFKDILAKPDKIKISEEPSHLYAITGMVANNINESNLPKLMAYIERLPKEFQVITLQNCIVKNKALVKIKEVQGWIKANASELM